MSDDPAGARGSAGQPEASAGRKAQESASEDSHAEQVLSQALRLMAGGEAGRSGTPGIELGAAPGSPSAASSSAPSADSRRRLSTGQLLLLAAILGLLVGIAAGFVSLLL
ncbi:hypothetical protein ACVBEQ_06005 [Nakamurella sp. GG22]